MKTNDVRESAFQRRAKGTGTVYKLSGKRSKPWVASVTTGRNINTGKQIQTVQGYFSTREDAIDCLTLHMLKSKNIVPDEIKDVPNLEHKYVNFIYSLIDQNIVSADVREIKDSSLINSMFMVKVAQEGINIKSEKAIALSTDVPTVEEIWYRLLDTDLKHLTNRSMANYRVSFNNIKKLHNRKINTIAYDDLQSIFDDLMKKGTGHSKMNNMKIVLNYIFRYAMKYDWIEKNYVQFIDFNETLKEEDKKPKEAFDKDTLRLIYSHSENDLICMSLLVMSWTGMRPSEFLGIRKENIHLEERYMIGGIKTKNGINRIIPIHECIIPYIKELMKNDSKYLFSIKGRKVSYENYLYHFNFLKKNLRINDKYTPHCGRHTFATVCDESELNEFLVKKIAGHSARDLTKDVYTHVTTERLIKEIDLLPSIAEYIAE